MSRSRLLVAIGVLLVAMALAYVVSRSQPSTSNRPVPSGSPSPSVGASAASPSPSEAPAGPPPAPAGFVTRRGTRLFLDGAPYRFTGINVYNANSRPISTCWYTLNQGTRLDETLAALAGQTAIRSHFYQGLALNAGVRDWTAFDKTLAVAAAHGIKVIVSLAGEGGGCKDYPTDVPKLESWYRDGYRQAEVTGVSYRDWVKEVVTRYKDNPTVLLWQPMGEAEDPTSWGSYHTCSATANQTLKAWADDVDGLIKSIDPYHLTTVGTIGSGQCGASGTAYVNLYSGPNIDLCEREDYGHPTDPMPGDIYNGMLTRINQCKAMNKPLFVGESGIRGSEVAGSLVTRAEQWTAKLQAQFAAGVVGELIWDWRDVAEGGSSTTGYEVGPGDPALGILTVDNPGRARVR